MTKKFHGVKHIENRITDALKPLFKGDKKQFLIINNIAKNWEKIVGKKYAKLCYPKSINFARAKKKGEKATAKLTIAVYNSAVGFFLQSNSEMLLEKIAMLYGYKAVHKITVKQEAKEVKGFFREEVRLPQEKEQVLQADLDGVEDEELKETLLRLGRDILGRKD